MNEQDNMFDDSISSYKSSDSFLKISQEDNRDKQSNQEFNTQLSNSHEKNPKQTSSKLQELKENSLRSRFKYQDNRGRPSNEKYKNKKNNKQYQKDVKVNKGPVCSFLYRPNTNLPDLTLYQNNTIEIKISKEYLKPINNAFIKRLIWGSDTYTSNSDILCIMKHMELYNFEEPIQQRYEGVSLFCKITKNKKSYQSVYRNGIKSRQSKNYLGNSLKPECLIYLETLGKDVDLNSLARRMPIGGLSKRIKIQKEITPISNPIFQNLFVFNLCNEYAYKYDLYNICDKSYESNMLSQRLKQKTLYLETNIDRFELSLIQKPQKDNDIFSDDKEHYKLSKLNDPFQKDNLFFDEQNIPLKQNHLQTIFDVLDWQSITWGNNSIQIKDFLIQSKKLMLDIQSYKYYPNKQITQNYQKKK